MGSFCATTTTDALHDSERFRRGAAPAEMLPLSGIGEALLATSGGDVVGFANGGEGGGRGRGRDEADVDVTMRALPHLARATGDAAEHARCALPGVPGEAPGVPRRGCQECVVGKVVGLSCGADSARGTLAKVAPAFTLLQERELPSGATGTVENSDHVKAAASLLPARTLSELAIRKN